MDLNKLKDFELDNQLDKTITLSDGNCVKQCIDQMLSAIRKVTLSEIGASDASIQCTQCQKLGLVSGECDILPLVMKRDNHSSPWVSTTLSSLLESVLCYQENCKSEVDSLKMEAEMLLDFTWQKLNTGHWKDVPIYWRYVYTFTTISLLTFHLKSLAMCVNKNETSYRTLQNKCKLINYKADMGIIMGAPIKEKLLSDIASNLNYYARLSYVGRTNIQPDLTPHTDLKYLNEGLVTRKLEEIDEPPITVFMVSYVVKDSPVKLLNVIKDWKALKEWSFDYLRGVAGSRTVPVEIGARYTDINWGQELMSLDEYFDKFLCQGSSSPTGYLAQHDLLDQIDELRQDVKVPDYCYCGDGSEPRINAWVGPSGTISPLHTDPDHNILCQVIGYKYIKLYTADQTPLIYPHESSLLDNTSQVDVENPNLEEFPLFASAQHSDLILSPGESLFIPKGCWHYVRSLTPSVSVSFWFKPMES